MNTQAASVAAGLLEREREIERLDAAIAAATGGVGAVVALEGEAGIGKSSLLTHAVAVAQNRGMSVLDAHGGELEREFAYGVVRQLFEAPLASAAEVDRQRWLTGAARVAAPVVSAAAPELGRNPDEGAVLHSLYWLSANLSIERPLLLAVDDAHWADDASIAFLSYLARRVDELAILIVYAARIGEGASEALPATAEPTLHGASLRPQALSEAGTAKLVAQLLGKAGSTQFARACHRATVGNPFLLGELLLALDADGIVPDDTSTTRIEQIAPTSIARATLARLRRLGPAAGELAFAVAVLGASAELRHAATLARLDLETAVEASDILTSAAILTDGRPLRFIHPIVRTTIYNELAPGRRAASHKRAALLLAQDGAGAVALVAHLLATEPSGDPWVVEQLRAAAREVRERGAPAAAGTYLQRALAEPPGSSDRPAVMLELGTAKLRSERSKNAAIDHLRNALEDASDTQVRTDAAVALAFGLAWSGRFQEVVELLDPVIEQIGEHDEEAAMQLDGLVGCWSQLGDATWRLAGDRLERYEGRLHGSSAGELMLLAVAAFDAAHRDEPAVRAAQLAELAIADGRLLAEQIPDAPNFFLAAWTLVEADHLDEAERYYAMAIEHARARGSLPGLAIAASCRCQIRFRQGRIAEAEAEARSVLDVAPVRRLALIACVLDAMVERADFDACEALLREEAIEEDLAGQAMASRLLYSRGHMRLAAGAPEAALRDFEQIRGREERWGLETASVPTRASAALAHARLGDREIAQALADEEVQRARRWRTPSALSFALRAAGIVADRDQRIELLREAAAAGKHSPARLEHARSLTELGTALRRAGHRRDARQTLREALDLADRCGALSLAARTRDELVATGARPRRPALRGRDALTPSERRVAQLAADGLGNREIAQALFVSARTVEGHLTHAYMKLDISSREQLPEALADTSG
jgi:DNA-binding CsgD family transcriptional regulator